MALKILTFQPMPIFRASLRVEREIREAILDGRLKSGDKLPTEKELSNQFGVSSVTLREALRSLKIFGLIQKKKGYGGGIFVSDAITNESVRTSLEYFLAFKDLIPQHLYEVRKIIEPRAIRLAASKISPDELRKLEENLFYCEEKIGKGLPCFSEEDFYDVDQKNIDFHKLIAESTHNPILGLTVEYVLVFLSRYVTSRLLPNFDFALNSVRDHRKMFDCLKQKDEESCEKEMTLHLTKLEEYLMHFDNALAVPGEVSSPMRGVSPGGRMRNVLLVPHSRTGEGRRID